MTVKSIRSFSSRELAYLIPTIYFCASEGSSVYILSPWINVNVQLNLPFTNMTSNRKVKLIDLIKMFREQRKVNTVFYIRSIAQNEQAVKILKENNFEVHVFETLHAKAIVSDRLVYRGSANITESGVYINMESCTLERCHTSPNEYLRRVLSELM